MKEHPLKTWRAKASLSQAQFALRAQLRQCSISLIEKQRRRPSLAAAVRLVGATNGDLPLEAFLFPDEFQSHHQSGQCEDDQSTDALSSQGPQTTTQECADVQQPCS